MDLWETPKLLVLCELVCLAQLWTSVAAACAAKFRHIPSALAADWGKSMTSEEISETLCRKMFYVAASKYGFPIPPQAYEEPPAFVGIARDVCAKLREVRIRHIQDALKTIEAQQQQQQQQPKKPVQPTPANTMPALVADAGIVKKQVHTVKRPTGLGTLPLPMPISIIPPK
jgi:hypothetical protein